ncbi:MAG TPA: S9 family peptidase [Pyrinomonadaceae bacterium]|jgi:dipeptidyl aminopeptidase/acylaminoacyl peptidase|nr:S9 family peptidase [Pyrinomonadaceae bacterium]
MRRRSTAVLFALALAAVALAPTLTRDARAQSQRDRLGVELFMDWELVASPQVSPDGRQIVYTRRWADKVNDKYEDEVWIMDADGGRNRFFANGSQAAWSPDSRRVAYVAQGQPAGAQVFVKWLDVPSESQLTRLERSPSNLAWSPDGRHIAFNMLVPGTPSLTVKMPARPTGAKWVDAPRVVERMNYRNDGSGWRPEGFAHVFVISSEGGSPRQLTEGDYQHGSPEWSADSQSVFFSAVRKPDAEYLRNDSEIYAVGLQGGAIRQLTDRKGPDNSPTISPDGKLIAYTGSDQNDNTYNVSHLYVMNADGSNKRALTEAFDRAPSNVFWSEDNGGLYFVTEDRGSQNLWFISASGGAPQQLTRGAQVLSFNSSSRDGLLVGTRSAADRPTDVYALRVPTQTSKTRGFSPAAADLKRLTSVNDDLLEGRKVGQVEEIWYDSVGMSGQQKCVAANSDPAQPKASDCASTKVQGWIVKPPDFDASKKYPLLLYIHGGPHSMYGVGFNFEFQNHASEGYVVLYTNPRGSTGYGQAFGNAINNAYPGQDYDDLMRGVDEVVKRGYVDERNLFVTGGSGGGVLTTWIVGHTDRFAAAVAMKPVVNWYSFVGTTDSADWYYNFKQLPWEDPAEHIRRSPITYVGNVKTPTMILTGDIDLRTPLEQTEQYYRALKMRRVPTAMVRLSDEYHGFNGDFSLRHPSNRVAQILFLRAWFDRHRRQ